MNIWTLCHQKHKEKKNHLSLSLSLSLCNHHYFKNPNLKMQEQLFSNWMLVTKCSFRRATDGSGELHSATWTITHSWQNHGWLICLSGWQEHKMVVYFILYFMLELLFFFPLTKVWSYQPGRYSSQKLWKGNKYLWRQVLRCCWTFQNGFWPHTCSGRRRLWRCWRYVESRHPWWCVWGDAHQTYSFCLLVPS